MVHVESYRFERLGLRKRARQTERERDISGTSSLTLKPFWSTGFTLCFLVSR